MSKQAEAAKGWPASKVEIRKISSIIPYGDIWELGGHRLLCGDSTDKKNWAALFGRDVASMVWTDPPYGVSYEDPAGKFEVIAGDRKRRDDLYKMLVGAFAGMVSHTKPKAAFYIWHASSTRNDFTEAMTAAGLTENEYLIWAKPSGAFGRADYKWAHEPAFYASKSGNTPDFHGEPNETTVWRVSAVTTEETSVVIGTGLVLLDGEGRSLYVQPKTPKGKKLREIRLTGARPRVVLADDAGDSTVWEVARDKDYKHPTQKPVELQRAPSATRVSPARSLRMGLVDRAPA